MSLSDQQTVLAACESRGIRFRPPRGADISDALSRGHRSPVNGIEVPLANGDPAVFDGRMSILI